METRQIDLFTGLEISRPLNPEKESYLYDSAAHILNPCEGCDLKEWCSDDDCAKKGYPIDRSTGHFKNLDEMITYLRTHNILGL